MKIKSVKLVYFFVLVFLLVSCKTPLPYVRSLINYNEIDQGDTITLHWDFANAKYVKIFGQPYSFNPQDSFRVSPKSSTRYDIIAFNEKGDSLVQSVYVAVRMQKETAEQVEAQRTIQRGPIGITDITSVRSAKLSNYFSGFISAGQAKIEKLKIVRATEDDSNYYLDFIILDKYGNQIYDIQQYTTDVQVSVTQNCAESKLQSRIEFPQLTKIQDDALFHLVVDRNCYTSTNNLQNIIADGMKYLNSTDDFAFSVFGNELETLLQPEFFEKNIRKFRNISVEGKAQLTCFYKSLYEIAKSCEPSKHNVVVVLTSSPENASIKYTIEDVIDIARSQNVKLYIVGIGNEIIPSALRYLATATGGNFYHLYPNELKDLSEILTEIILAERYYYRARVSKFDFKSKCSELKFDVSLAISSANLSDFFVYPIGKKDYFLNYQAIASFDYLSTDVSSDFAPIIGSVAEILVKHRDLGVELSGNASLDEKNYDCISLSFSRANNVRKQLISLGVNPNQIQVKGRGISKPLSLFEDDEKSKFLNRRVEIRWLHPSILPYTIVVDTVESEEKAENGLLLWERRGYQPYYERILHNDGVRYIIVLWGYSTFEQAEKEARLIQKRYKTSAVTE